MASPMSGQGKPKPACVVIGYPSGLVQPGFTSFARHSVLFHIIKPLLIKLVRFRWLDIASSFFFVRVYGLRLRLGP